MSKFPCTDLYANHQMQLETHSWPSNRKGSDNASFFTITAGTVIASRKIRQPLVTLCPLCKLYITITPKSLVIDANKRNNKKASGNKPTIWCSKNARKT
jgi:hypothetical protein